MHRPASEARQTRSSPAAAAGKTEFNFESVPGPNPQPNHPHFEPEGSSHVKAPQQYRGAGAAPQQAPQPQHAQLQQAAQQRGSISNASSASQPVRKGPTPNNAFGRSDSSSRPKGASPKGSSSPGYGLREYLPTAGPYAVSPRVSTDPNAAHQLSRQHSLNPYPNNHNEAHAPLERAASMSRITTDRNGNAVKPIVSTLMSRPLNFQR